MKTKTLIKKTRVETVIYEWIQPEGFDLAVCCIKDVTFKRSLNVVFGRFEEFKKFIKVEYEQIIDDEDALAMAFSFDDKKKGHWNFINIQRNDWTANDYGTITHELHHFVHFSLQNMGVDYGTAGEEVFAYSQGYFMEMIVRAFQELRKWKGYKKLNNQNKTS